MTPFDDLNLLRAFVHIVESGSISAAARSLSMPQPTLSRHLRALEENCGVALLSRDPHHLVLTEAGRRLHSNALALLDQAEETARHLKDGCPLTGHLRVVSSMELGPYTVTRIIASFLERHPGITAELSYCHGPLHSLSDGFDAGVVVGAVADERFVVRKAGWIHRYLVAAPALVEARPAVKKPADLKTWPWLALSGNQSGDPGQVVLQCAKRGPAAALDIQPIFLSEGVTSLREAVLHGTGVAILPDFQVRDDVATWNLIRLLPQWHAPPFPVHVIHHDGRPLPGRVRTFMDFAVDYLIAELGPAGGN